MQLSGQQMQELCAAMGTSFNMTPLAMFLRFHLERELDDLAGPGTKPERIFETVDHADRNGWLEDLLTKLVAEGPNEDLKELAEGLARVLSGTGGLAGGGADTLEACLVSRRAFVDREDFRRLMRDLRDDQGRVAIIKGPKGGGNSHSWFFIEHLARETGTVRARLVDLRDWKNDEGPSPDDVMMSIASRLDLAPDNWPADDLAQGSRRADKLVSWLVGKSPALAEHCWLVIDHLDRVGLREDTVELAEQLAIEVEKGNCEKLSLVLIGFGRSLEASLDPFILRDAPAGFAEPHVRKHFESLAASAGHSISPQKLSELVDETFDALSPVNPTPGGLPFTKEQMYELGSRLARLSALVLRGEGLQ